jgi:RNA polymerase sigma-70 factor (ECF subfamily)
VNNTEKESDETLAARVANDRDVFGELITRYEQPLSRYMRRLGVANSEDRADVLQNTFIKAYRNINSFDPSLSFSAWIYRIAHNESISFFRSKNSRPEGHLVDDGEEILNLLHDDTDIIALTEQGIQHKEILQALEKIDQKYRDAIILRYFEELDYSEISDILEIPPGSVATLLHRAKKQLKELLIHLQ